MSDVKDRTSGSGKSSRSTNTSKVDGQLLDALKHYDSFYEKPPPGLIKDEEEERPEDVIPDTPANSAAREFLAKAPTKGLWMPLGKEVKVMKCWRCKNYGHRTGDKECPLFLSGNKESEEFRHLHEDPMYNYVKESEIRVKLEKVQMLKNMLASSKDKKKVKKKKSKKEKKHRKREEKKRPKKRSRRETDSSSDSSSSSSSTSSSSSDSDHSRRKRKNMKRKHHQRKDQKRSR